MSAELVHFDAWEEAVFRALFPRAGPGVWRFQAREVKRVAAELRRCPLITFVGRPSAPVAEQEKPRG